jgi:hypothetical protein
MRCFGYCMIDRDAAYRETALRAEHAAAVKTGRVLPYDAASGDEFDAAALIDGPEGIER